MILHYRRKKSTIIAVIVITMIITYGRKYVGIMGAQFLYVVFVMFIVLPFVSIASAVYSTSIDLKFNFRVCDGQRTEDAVADFLHINNLDFSLYSQILETVCHSAPLGCDGGPPSVTNDVLYLPEEYGLGGKYNIRRGYSKYEVADCICDLAFDEGCSLSHRLAVIDRISHIPSSVKNRGYLNMPFHDIPLGMGEFAPPISLSIADQFGAAFNLYISQKQRVEDAVDDFTRNIAPPLTAEQRATYRSDLLHQLCPILDTTIPCDGDPPREVIGHTMWIGTMDKPMVVPVRKVYSAEDMSNFLCAISTCSNALWVILRHRIQTIIDAELASPGTFFEYPIFGADGDIVLGKSMSTTLQNNEETGGYGDSTASRTASITNIISDQQIEHMMERSTPAPYDISISLGFNCFSAAASVAVRLRSRKAQGYKTGPFDLLLSNYNGIVRCLLEDCKHLTNSTYLTLRPVLTKSNETDGPFIYNTRYKFAFTHESFHSPFVVGSNTTVCEHFMANDYEALKDRYNRRWSDFVKNIHSNQTILFTVSGGTPSVAHGLFEVLHEKYPDLRFNIGMMKFNADSPNGTDILDHHRIILDLDESELT